MEGGGGGGGKDSNCFAEMLAVPLVEAIVGGPARCLEAVNDGVIQALVSLVHQRQSRPLPRKYAQGPERLALELGRIRISRRLNEVFRHSPENVGPVVFRPVQQVGND